MDHSEGRHSQVGVFCLWWHLWVLFPLPHLTRAQWLKMLEFEARGCLSSADKVMASDPHGGEKIRRLWRKVCLHLCTFPLPDVLLSYSVVFWVYEFTRAAVAKHRLGGLWTTEI